MSGDVFLTEPEILHLLRLLEMNRDEGSYFGTRKYYWQRHENIENKLYDALGVSRPTEEVK